MSELAEMDLFYNSGSGLAAAGSPSSGGGNNVIVDQGQGPVVMQKAVEDDGLGAPEKSSLDIKTVLIWALVGLVAYQFITSHKAKEQAEDIGELDEIEPEAESEMEMPYV